jgi:hypothetical protein
MNGHDAHRIIPSGDGILNLLEFCPKSSKKSAIPAWFLTSLLIQYQAIVRKRRHPDTL